MLRPRRSAAMVVALACLGFVVAALVASGGPVRLWHQPPPGRGEIPPPSEERVEEPSEQLPTATLPRFEEDPSEDLGRWFTTAVLTLIAILLVISLYGVVTGLTGRRPPRPRPDTPAPGTALPLVDAPQLELDESAQLAALLDGPVRNAIVACWLQMESDVAEAGTPRHIAETSAEYTARVLAGSSLEADADAVRELAALYREARFSRHEMGEADRGRALAALQQIHRSLAAQREMTATDA